MKLNTSKRDLWPVVGFAACVASATAMLCLLLLLI